MEDPINAVSAEVKVANSVDRQPEGKQPWKMHLMDRPRMWPTAEKCG